MREMTDFEREVYDAVREIPAGETRTYGWVAERIGRPGAARAVGNALHKNPFAPEVPCHRVVGARGKLGGYRYGAEKKRWILNREASQTGKESKW